MREHFEIAGVVGLAIAAVAAGLGLLLALILGYFWVIGSGLGLAVAAFCRASGLCT